MMTCAEDPGVLSKGPIQKKPILPALRGALPSLVNTHPLIALTVEKQEKTFLTDDVLKQLVMNSKYL